MKYLIYFLNTCLLIMIPLSVLEAKPSTFSASSNRELKKLNTQYVMANRTVAPTEIKQEETKEEESEETEELEETPKAEEKVEEVVKVEKVKDIPQAPKTPSVSSPSPAPSQPSNSYVGSLSGYKPDCPDCRGTLSCRLPDRSYYNVKALNTMYYHDSQYGNVRIVAADTDFPCGTIVRISPSIFSSSPMIAIVLDRGGDIGFNGKFLFDLLFTVDTRVSGVSRNVTFTVLRTGW